MKKVYVLLADGFEEIEAITQVDVLRRADIEVETISIKEELSVTGGFNITVIADQRLSDVDLVSADMIVLPGGLKGMSNLNLCDEVKVTIEKFIKQDKWVAAICAAPKILGDMGLLDGRKAICYPGFENSLVGAKIQNKRVVVDEKIITSKGPGTALEFAYKLVEVLKGQNDVINLKQKMIFD